MKSLNHFEITLKSAEVYDLNGKLIQQTDITNDAIGVESLSIGTYILRVRDENGKDYAQKFIKE